MYVVVVFGVTEMLLPVLPPGDHVKMPFGTVDVAVKFATCPAHTVTLLTLTIGIGLIVTVTVVNGDTQF